MQGVSIYVMIIVSKRLDKQSAQCNNNLWAGEISSNRFAAVRTFIMTVIFPAFSFIKQSYGNF